MKFNKYVRHYELEDLHILYNMQNDVTVIVSCELFSLMKNEIRTPIRIQEINQSLYDKFTDNGFIVNAMTDETDQLIKLWQKEDLAPSCIKLTINPTLECNLSCWYCYENHNGHSQINFQTLIAIKNLISKTLCKPSLDKLVLDFFGGEPLLYFELCVRPLIEYANKMARSNKKRLGISITTNATLLSEKVCQVLSGINGCVSLQITLDGSREFHNNIRYFKSGVGSFDIIISNIKRALAFGFVVTVRFNYTSKNFQSYEELLSEFEDIDEASKKK